MSDAPIRPAVLDAARFEKAPFYVPHQPPAVTMADLEAAAAKLCQSVFLTRAEMLAEAEAALTRAEFVLADRRAELARFEAMRPGDPLGWRHRYATATQAWIDMWLDIERAGVITAEAAHDAAQRALAELMAGAQAEAA